MLRIYLLWQLFILSHFHFVNHLSIIFSFFSRFRPLAFVTFLVTLSIYFFSHSQRVDEINPRIENINKLYFFIEDRFFFPWRTTISVQIREWTKISIKNYYALCFHEHHHSRQPPPHREDGLRPTANPKRSEEFLGLSKYLCFGFVVDVSDEIRKGITKYPRYPLGCDAVYESGCEKLSNEHHRESCPFSSFCCFNQDTDERVHN